MNTEELLQEAKRRFPIGCTYYAVQSIGGGLSQSIDIQRKECYIYKSSGKDWIIGSSNIYNPETNEWAEIISMPKIKEIIYKIY